MSKVVSHDSESRPYCSISELSRRETASYIHDMLGSIQEIALDKDMSTLARLIACARDEAKSFL
jgi:hypothetical protein